VSQNITGMSTMVKKHAQNMAKIIEEDNLGEETFESRRLKDLKASPSFIQKNLFGKFSSLNSSPSEKLLSDDSMSGTASSNNTTTAPTLSTTAETTSSQFVGKTSKASRLSLKRVQAASPYLHEKNS
jgi:hypothetical protein